MLMKRDFRARSESFQPAQTQRARPLGNSPWGQALDGLRDGANMGGRRPAAAAEDIQPALLGPFAKLRRESFRRFRKPGFGDNGSGRPALG